MKNLFRGIGERAGELGDVVWYSLLVVVAVTVLGGGIYAFDRMVYPAWLSYQREMVEESKSFNDSTNIALSNYIREYNALEVKIAEAEGDSALTGPYKAQQKAILGQMCQVVVTMNDVAPDNRQFLAAHGGCQ